MDDMAKGLGIGFSRTLRCTTTWKRARVLGGYLTLGFCLLFWSSVLIKDTAGAGVGQDYLRMGLNDRGCGVELARVGRGLGMGYFGGKVRARAIMSGDDGVSGGLAKTWRRRLNVERKRRMGSDGGGCRGWLKRVGPCVVSGSNRVQLY